MDTFQVNVSQLLGLSIFYPNNVLKQPNIVYSEGHFNVYEVNVCPFQTQEYCTKCTRSAVSVYISTPVNKRIRGSSERGHTSSIYDLWLATVKILQIHLSFCAHFCGTVLHCVFQVPLTTWKQHVFPGNSTPLSLSVYRYNYLDLYRYSAHKQSFNLQ